VSPGRVAVIINPRSGRPRRRARLIAQVELALGGGGELHQPEGLPALREVCDGLAGRGVDHVAIVGGDGTVSRTLTAIAGSWGDRPWPTLALLGGGTMNTLARAFGARGLPARGLAAVLTHASGARRRPVLAQPTLRVDGGRVGMLFGTGLFARYIQDYDAAGGGLGAAAWVLARAVASALVGGATARRLTARHVASVEIDGGAPIDGRWLTVAAGVIPDVGLGFRPFRRVRGAGDAFAYLGIGCAPFALALRMGRAFVGADLDHPEVVEGLARRVVLRGPADVPYMMDGDVGLTGPETILERGPVAPVLWLGAAAPPARVPVSTPRPVVKLEPMESTP